MRRRRRWWEVWDGRTLTRARLSEYLEGEALAVLGMQLVAIGIRIARALHMPAAF
jgi:hypothetical protein